MQNSMATLEWIDAGEKGKWLAVREEYIFTTPVRQILYYPVCEGTEARARECYDLPQELRSWGEGRYTFASVGGRQITVLLLDGGKTIPVKTIEEPIACSKVRKGIETRWNSSRRCWQKYLKSAGWVAA